MSDREKVIGHLYDCLAASKPENLWVFVRKDIVGDALNLLKEQDSMIEDARSQGWSDGYHECEREYQENM